MAFGPKQITFSDILVNGLGSLIAGIIGSIVILIITFVLGNSVDVPGTFAGSEIGFETSSIFPLILSVITLIATTITLYLTYRLLTLTSEERYKKNIVISGQIAFFAFIVYVFITPIYIYAGTINYEYIMYIFLAHTLIVTFGTSILLELLNNYRHVLIGLYGSFVGLFVSMSLTALIFTSFSTGSAKLIALVLLLPLINFSVTFFKQLFELSYYYYYKYTNQDQLGDIFYQIEMEEKELLKEEEEKNSI
ncbi:MAG: hypothetical protein QM490_00425 [Candidatus Gracilibacteria bacterium]